MKEVEILGAPGCLALGRARLNELGLWPEATSLLGGGVVGRGHLGLVAACSWVRMLRIPLEVLTWKIGV